jgi:hypothetical protein
MVGADFQIIRKEAKSAFDNLVKEGIMDNSNPFFWYFFKTEFHLMVGRVQERVEDALTDSKPMV